MKNPLEVEVLVPGATYELPTFKVGDKGLEDAGHLVLYFCKGRKNKPDDLRQQGVLTDSVVVALLKYLEENNVGNLKSEFTDKQIEALKEVLNQSQLRAADRIKREVQQTDKA